MAPDRIYNWLDSQLSIARFYGGIQYNGTRYVIAHDEEGQPLVRWDVLKAEAKAKAKKPKQVIDDTQGGLFDEHRSNKAGA
jgi:hypothetical protein